MEVEIGFKRLTPENWLEPASVMRVFRYSAEEWVHDITAVRLSEDVPLEVRKLFAAARGAVCYGYFFYPLYALASEQLARVAEAAVSRKYEATGGPKRVRRTPRSKPRKATFEEKLKYLEDQGIIAGPDVIWWGAIREARNDARTPRTTARSPLAWL
jgi:hypothetical protein